MSSGSTSSNVRPARRLVRRRVGAAAAVAAAGALAVLWAERRPIAASAVDRVLAAAHVRARYRVADLGLGRQRLVDVVVGDPAHPELTADWIELGTRIGLDGATVTAVRAGRLRLAGRVADGRLSLGSLDRLLPASAGGPFRLPGIDLDLSDGEMALATPAGPLLLRLAGRGRLDGGFRGVLGVAGGRLALGRCVGERVSGAARIVIGSGPALRGPLRAGTIRCGPARTGSVRADAALDLDAALSRWRGELRLAPASVAAPRFRLAALAGTASFRGSADLTRAAVSLFSGSAVAGDAGADRLALTGRFDAGRPGNRGAVRFAGRVGGSGARLPRRWLDAVADRSRDADGTPVGPVVARLAQVIAGAGRSLDGWVDLTADADRVTVRRAGARARTGAMLAFSGRDDASVPLGHGRPRGAGVLRVAGGGLPRATAELVIGQGGAALRGAVTAAPYRAAYRGVEAGVALAPVAFAVAPDGRLSLRTTATVSGPLPDGRVEGLALPVALDRAVGGDLLIGPGCATLSFRHLALASLRLDAGRLPLCPTGRALVRVRRGRVLASASTARVRLAGRLGSAPVTLAVGGARLDWSRRSFAVSSVEGRLGAGASATRLSLGEVTGTAAPDGSGGGFGGRFADAGGQIGAVPLLLSDASGGWRYGGGALSLKGGLTVADAAPDPRFVPLRAEDATLALAGGVITARARLVASAKGVPVADALIVHDLAAGSGRADLVAAALHFDDRLQPDDLTRLTRGVIADVRGTVGGDARIAWDGRSVASTGRFRTEGLDLAAAFGPVTGLAGSVRFTDLLSLASEPGQVVTLASVNPGVLVTDGRIAFQLLPGARVRLEGGRWPFAGGELRLEPASLDLSADAARRLTFTLAGVDAAQFLQQFDFGNVSATGTFDGSLPMVFDEAGGRIEGGRLSVRRGGNIAYLGDLTREDLGFWGNLAFRALRSIDYRDLTIGMNGPLAGEMITEIRFGGISQGKGAEPNFLVRRLEKLPFVFNIRIKAPFRGLVDSAQSFYDPSRLIGRNLPALLREQASPAQPDNGQPSERRNVPGPTPR